MARSRDPGAARSAPECLVLAPRPGAPLSESPPVRIFLGSEPAQARAERVFVWSIERVRDPGRRYEIHVMKQLAGFDPRRWTTGFTQYRFAIPDFAASFAPRAAGERPSGSGRAIYNDVDQIYLCDPAQLFDAEFDGCGYRSVDPGDTSVMLIDCDRMRAHWSLARAQRESKRRLHARAQSVPGLWGALDRSWNARDGEAGGGDARLIHFTTLHTQPWRPFPEHYAYQPNPVGALWHTLEAEADAHGFLPRTRERPSDRYAEWRLAWTGSADDAEFAPPVPGSPRAQPARELRAGPWLAEAPDDDIDWLLAELCASARERAAIELPDCPRRERDRWEERLARAARHHPGLTTAIAFGRAQRFGGAWWGPTPPRVWVLRDDRPGNTTQALGLAEALTWPYEVKQLRCRAGARLHNRWLGASLFGIDREASTPLEPPWPDLVIAAGRRTAPVAEWIRAQSHNRARIVALGRKTGDDADRFDRVVTPSYARLFPHPRRIETSGPLHRVTRDALAKAREEWADRLADAPAPRIAVLVGGTSGQYRLGSAEAERFGAACAELARACGGSLFVTTSRRLGPEATDALCAAVGEVHFLHRWRSDDPSNPYLGLLAHADAFVITGDSESMLAEATSLGRPVAIYRLPVRGSFRVLSAFREWVWRRATAQPLGPRGTPRPQRGLERWSGRAIERGYVRPSRDLDRLHAALFERGSARPFDGSLPLASGAPCDDRESVAAAVREMMGVA
ncbi:MAG TPA: ELM1/GtrOC1 family putative glycosyltransferase [Myxococcota bacterium]|nr:ELM1/GtrOC1 family putative glycosyltransferase [Myxococcota bacterium]